MKSFDVESNEDHAHGAMSSLSPASGHEKPSHRSKDTSQADWTKQRASPPNCSPRGSYSQSQGSCTSTATSIGRSPAHSQTPCESSQSSSSSPRKVQIPPARKPSPRPKRTERLPLSCPKDSCDQILACKYDLKRHLEDVHGQCLWVYRCNEPSCGRVRSRKDKVKDHCDKMAHQRHGISRIYVGDGQNADVLEAMRRQRSRKKGKPASGCEKGGSKTTR